MQVLKEEQEPREEQAQQPCFVAAAWAVAAVVVAVAVAAWAAVAPVVAVAAAAAAWAAPQAVRTSPDPAVLQDPEDQADRQDRQDPEDRRQENP